MTDSKDYSLSLRLTNNDSTRIKKITKSTGQNISEFIRCAIRERIETEEIRLMELEIKRKNLQKQIQGK